MEFNCCANVESLKCENSHDWLPASIEGEQCLEVSSREQFLDVDNPKHLKQLMEWCKFHWMVTFKRAIAYGNRMFFNYCCFCFCRRAFSKRAGHPAIWTISLLQIKNLRDAKDHIVLFDWLVSLARDAKEDGRLVLFPSLNREHTEIDQQMQIKLESDERDTMLAKRAADLETELDQVKEANSRLRVENAKLIKSTKYWHQKWSVLQQQREDESAFLQTPSKHKVNDSLFLENY